MRLYMLAALIIGLFIGVAGMRYHEHRDRRFEEFPDLVERLKEVRQKYATDHDSNAAQMEILVLSVRAEERGVKTTPQSLAQLLLQLDVDKIVSNLNDARKYAQMGATDLAKTCIKRARDEDHKYGDQNKEKIDAVARELNLTE